MKERGSEKAFQRTVIKHLNKMGVFAEEIEGCTRSGIPDCFFSSTNGYSGWIELKYCRDYFSQIHFGFRQKLFFAKHGRNRCPCFLLIKHAGINTYFILDFYNAIHIKFNGDNEEMYNRSIKIWRGNINYEELAKILRREN